MPRTPYFFFANFFAAVFTASPQFVATCGVLANSLADNPYLTAIATSWATRSASGVTMVAPTIKIGRAHV